MMSERAPVTSKNISFFKGDPDHCHRQEYGNEHPRKVAFGRQRNEKDSIGVTWIL
jgi:hypothetical protein